MTFVSYAFDINTSNSFSLVNKILSLERTSDS